MAKIFRMNFPAIPIPVYVAEGAAAVTALQKSRRVRLWITDSDLMLISKACKGLSKKKRYVRMREAMRYRATQLNITDLVEIL